MSSGQESKRKNRGDDLIGREKKKQKLSVARTISVQPFSMSHPRSGVVNGAYVSFHPLIFGLRFE